MKQLFTTAGVLFSMTAFAQVGINNTSPKATLDITAKTSGTKPEGLIIPQLTGDQIHTATITASPAVYNTTHKGLIIYATSADSSPTGATANITAPGYYYFDGTAWQKILGSTSGDTTNDAWINDTTNSMVKIGTKADGTARATGTDFVVTDNGSVGIGTASPKGPLNISYNNATTAITNSTLSPGIILTGQSNASGGGPGLYFEGQNNNTGTRVFKFNLIKGASGDGFLNFRSISDDGTSVIKSIMSLNAQGYVGIGTETPKTFLQVQSPAGSANPVAAFSSVNCGAGCGQGTARNIVLNNNQSNNSLFASVDFVPGTDPTGSSGATIQGIDRDATNNYAGLSFYTRNATDYASRLAIKSSGSVGIGAGAESPNATLDVKAITAGTGPEGIIAPRLSLTALQGYAYGTNQTGAMVYVNSVSGTPTGQTANVTAVGYYFFDGTNWLKVNTGASVTDATTTAKGIVQLAGDLSGTAASPSIATSAVTSAKIADGTVANADLANMNALTVKGNATNAAAVPTDIAAGTDGYVLRRSGTALAFGTVDTAGITDGAVTTNKILDGTVANADLAPATGGIYKGGGSLSGNTTVAQGTNTLAFTSGATAGTSHFTVDGTTLNVDAFNHRVGIGTSAPQKPLHVNANNNSIRFENLPSLSSGSSSTALVVDANGDIYKNNTVSAEGQILRIGLNQATYSSSESGLRFNSNNDATEMGSAPNGAPNYINTIVGATISEGTTLTAGNGTPARTTDQIVLQPGVYKMQVRLVGYFASANSGNIVNLKATANNNEYSYTYFSNPTTTSGTYYYEDFINITGSAQAIDFTIAANSDFNVLSRLSPGTGQSYRSLIMIQKLR